MFVYSASVVFGTLSVNQVPIFPSVLSDVF